MYGQMNKYIEQRSKYAENGKEKYIEFPLANDMKEVGYDAIVLGNDEFVSNNRFYLNSTYI